MTDAASNYEGLNNQMNVADFFDKQYLSEPRYWWRDKDRYAPHADSYPFSLLTQMTLRLIGRPPGRVLDLGAGEGADSIRLALLGYDVFAVDISKVGAEKILMFMEEVGAAVNVEVADIVTYEPHGEFDLVICNGVLHYIDDKKPILERMQMATRPGGINVISLWSTYTPVPECHRIVPVSCDDEHGLVVKMYDEWIKEIVYFDRSKIETAHPGMPSHSHSHIKLIARKPESRAGPASRARHAEGQFAVRGRGRQIGAVDPSPPGGSSSPWRPGRGGRRGIQSGEVADLPDGGPVQRLRSRRPG